MTGCGSQVQLLELSLFNPSRNTGHYILVLSKPANACTVLPLFHTGSFPHLHTLTGAHTRESEREYRNTPG